MKILRPPVPDSSVPNAAAALSGVGAKRSLPRIVLASAVGVLIFVASAATQFGAADVRGYNWGSSNCGPDVYLSYCVADDRYHYVYLAGLTRSDIRTDTAYILDRELDNRTDMIASVVTGSIYDVRAWNNTYGDTGYWGAVYCPSGAAQGGSNPRRWCKPQYIRYNTTYAYKFDTAEERRSIACHELGHTAGLRHSGNIGDSCMYDPVLVTTLELHDLVMVNDRY